MARGNLPAITPQVSPEDFLAFDFLYRYLRSLNLDLEALEGSTLRVTGSKASNTTLATEIALRYPLLANASYSVNALLLTNGNFKLRHAGPAVPTRVQLTTRIVDAGVETVGLNTAYSASDLTCTGIGSISLEGIIQNGSTAGYFELQWAQAASSGTATLLYAGSRSIVSRIA
jgi:hypothetical protein